MQNMICFIRLDQGFPNFVVRGRGPHKLLHNSPRPDILRTVIVLGYVAIHQIKKFFVNTVFFQYWQNVFVGRKMALRADFARGP